MKFSDRTSWPRASNALTELKADFEKTGTPFVDLTVSNPTQVHFQYLNSNLIQSFQSERNLSYEPTARGLLKAREAVCAYYAEKGISLSPEQIFLTSSTSESYTFVFKLITDTGDFILAPAPSYPLFDYLAGLSDLNIERYPLVFKDKWKIGPIPSGAGAKAILAVHPNNPTGHFVSPEDFEILTQFAAKHKTAIISDEVFLDFDFGISNSKITSFAGHNKTLTFTLSGISKLVGLPQMKVSWLVVTGPEDLKREAIERLEVIADTFLSVSTPSQNALPDWLAFRLAAGGEILNRLKQNEAMLRNEMKSIPDAVVLPVEGGWYAVMRLPGRKTDEAWALSLLKEKRVFVHPGYFFDFPEGEFIVLSLLTKPDLFKEGARRIAGHIQ